MSSVRRLFKENLLIHLLLSFLAGFILVYSQPPHGMWGMLLIGFSVFYAVQRNENSLKKSFFIGWFFGFGYFLFGLSWIGNALLVDGNPYKMFWPLATAALPAALAIFTGLATLAANKICDFKKLSGFLGFAAILMLSEWLRGNIFTGFPWNLYGYTWAYKLPIAQQAAVGGIYWLSLLTCLWAMTPAFLFKWQAKRLLKLCFAISVLASFVSAYMYGVQRLNSNPTEIRQDIGIKIVQPNITQKDKWNPDKVDDNLAKLLELSEPERLNSNFTTLIVWPETAVTDYILQNPARRNAIKATLSAYEAEVFLAAGVMRIEKDQRSDKQYFNSIVLFDKRLNEIEIYNKSHLVPFGEYIPFQKWIPLRPVTNFKGFEKGSGVTTLDLPQGESSPFSFSPLICYEVIFPDAVVKQSNQPDLMINVTNDAWYGDSAGPRQHLAMAQFRAIEEGIPVARAANTGISALIDPLGRTPYKVQLNKTAGSTLALPQKLDSNQQFFILKRVLFFSAIALCLLVTTTHRLRKYN